MLIEPSDSPWASPVVLVTNKDGSTRFCVDYRWLTTKDAYQLPRIDDLLRLLGNQLWFSTMDLASGYWQVAMSPEAKRKAAFVTNEGLFQFRVMPFGLCNAPATFELLMDRVLCGMRWSRCFVYLDDVISFGKSIRGGYHVRQLQPSPVSAAILHDTTRDAGGSGDVYTLSVVSAGGSVHPSDRS